MEKNRRQHEACKMGLMERERERENERALKLEKRKNVRNFADDLILLLDNISLASLFSLFIPSHE